MVDVCCACPVAADGGVRNTSFRFLFVDEAGRLVLIVVEWLAFRLNRVCLTGVAIFTPVDALATTSVEACIVSGGAFGRPGLSGGLKLGAYCPELLREVGGRLWVKGFALAEAAEA